MGLVATTVVLLLPQKQAQALEELPMEWRRYTRLAPFGTNSSSKTSNSDKKTTGLSLEELAERLTHDLQYGSTWKGSYFLSGDISTDIFRDDCAFVDPNNRVDRLSQYQTALRILFDPQKSKLDVLGGTLQVDHEANEIRGTIRSRGFLQLPWKPYVTAYESDITYKVGRDDGLIYEQVQDWKGSKSASKALQETFTPTIYTPPPRSEIPTPSNEPAVVSKLFDYVNGRRPDEYSQEERFEIAQLITDVAALPPPSGPTATDNMLPGKWMLVYLQPGPNGEGIDRRIPFPEFPFNDNYQIFTRDTVTNIGELFGPNVFVQVSGGLVQVQQPRKDDGDDDDDDDDMKKKPQYRANIQGGKLCVGGGGNESCINLPIAGEGLFESVYLGDRLRIGQNLNGGGARVVQVRLS